MRSEQRLYEHVLPSMDNVRRYRTRVVRFGRSSILSVFTGGFLVVVIVAAAALWSCPIAVAAQLPLQYEWSASVVRVVDGNGRPSPVALEISAGVSEIIMTSTTITMTTTTTTNTTTGAPRIWHGETTGKYGADEKPVPEREVIVLCGCFCSPLLFVQSHVHRAKPKTNCNNEKASKTRSLSFKRFNGRSKKSLFV